MTRVAVLCGGVGAARLLTGLVRVVPPAEVTAVVNTADDMELHGLASDVQALVDRGNSAQNQLATYRAARDRGANRVTSLKDVVDWLVRTTAAVA